MACLVCAQALSEFRAFRIQIHADDATARGLENLHGELAKQSEPDDGYNVPQFHIGSANPVQRNCSHRGKSRLLE